MDFISVGSQNWLAMYYYSVIESRNNDVYTVISYNRNIINYIVNFKLL